jgi:hypothetical protein
VDGVTIAEATLFFFLAWIVLSALFTVGWVVLTRGRDDEYEPDTHFWMRRER